MPKQNTNMNPMKLESLVFQVHHPPVIPKVKLGDGRLGRLRWFHTGPNLQTRGSLDVYKVYQLQSGESSYNPQKNGRT